MRLGKQKQPAARSTRQRLYDDTAEKGKSVNQTYNYLHRRSETKTNTGRALRKDLLEPVVKQVGNFWLQRFGLAVLLIVGAICLVSAMTVTPNVTVVALDSLSQNTSYRNQQAYEVTANKLLANSVLNRTKLTLDTAKLRQELLNTYPEISDITITLPLISHRPIVYVSYTQPAVVLQNSSGSYVLDTNGKVLSTTTMAALHKNLPIIIDQSGFKLQVNHQVLSSGDISFIESVMTDLPTKQLSASSMTLPAAANELDVSIAGKPYFVKFNLHDGTVNQQLGSLLAVINRLQIENIAPGKYIDVRVAGRAYYQ